ANSAGIEARCRVLGAPATRVVRLGSDLPAGRAAPYAAPTVVTTGHVIARKRHADVLRAVALLTDRHPALRYLVIGDGPQLPALRALASELGVVDRLDLAGQLPGDAALARTRRATLFAMPSTNEAFGVAYVEAMAGWLPAIAAAGEPGPQEIVAAGAGGADGAGAGMTLVPPGDASALAAAIDALLADGHALREAGEQARATVERAFSWSACGAATVAAYGAALT
ncbi:MAG TPA: glycosyltransferase, partial [Solirubrobacteraceae bacterium]|nr:glycosyltransferase [Solirubrobacteraceae bacterium]